MAWAELWWSSSNLHHTKSYTSIYISSRVLLEKWSSLVGILSRGFTINRGFTEDNYKGWIFPTRIICFLWRFWLFPLSAGVVSCFKILWEKNVSLLKRIRIFYFFASGNVRNRATCLACCIFHALLGVVTDSHGLEPQSLLCSVINQVIPHL